MAIAIMVYMMTRPTPKSTDFPIASLRFGKLSIYGTFIPKVNNKLNNGNVAFFFGRYEFSLSKFMDEMKDKKKDKQKGSAA